MSSSRGEIAVRSSPFPWFFKETKCALKDHMDRRMHPVEAAKVQKRCDARAGYCKMVEGAQPQDLACSPLSGHLPLFSFVQWIPIFGIWGSWPSAKLLSIQHRAKGGIRGGQPLIPSPRIRHVAILKFWERRRCISS
jgi:hypothetical protein